MQDSHLNTILDFKPKEVMNGSNIYMEITDISSERLEIWVWGGLFSDCWRETQFPLKPKSCMVYTVLSGQPCTCVL